MKRSTTYIYLVVFYFFLNFISAQTPELDSLKVLLKSARQDTAKCYFLSKMIDAESDENIWSGYNEQIKVIAEKSLANNEQFRKVFLRYLGAAYINSGTIAQMKGNWTIALEEFQKGLNICDKNQDKEGVAIAVISLADIFRNQGDLPKALDYYAKSLRINEEINNKLGVAHALYMLAYVYKGQNDFEKAAEYNEKSLKIYTAIDFKGGIANCYSLIASVYDYQNNANSAMEYYFKAVKLLQDLGVKHHEASAYVNIGKLYFKIGKQNEALEYFQKALDLYTETEDKPGIATSLNHYAQVLLSINKTQQAFIYADKSMRLAKEIGYPENIRNASYILKQIYSTQGKYKEAVEMFELYIQMRDSIGNETARKSSIKKQYQIEYEREAIKDSLANAAKINEAHLKHEAAITQQRTFTYGGFAGLGLMLVVAGVSFRAYKNKQKANVIITEQKQFVDSQKHIIEEKQKEIIDSINYARRIQRAHLPSEKYIIRKLIELMK